MLDAHVSRSQGPTDWTHARKHHGDMPNWSRDGEVDTIRPGRDTTLADARTARWRICHAESSGRIAEKQRQRHHAQPGMAVEEES
jgi:hypothetical protein